VAIDMPLIVDANVATLTFREPASDDFAPVKDAIFEGRARLVFGGRLTREYQLISVAWRVLVALDRAGKATMVKDTLVDQREQELQLAGACKSDDWHIIALAQLANVRLLCSHDKALHADFTNKSLLSKPMGKVYQIARHARLLQTHGR
jgi:hypothetical protein